jgi:hypothetical protein
MRNCALPTGIARLLSISTVCLAQESRGSITGKVVDPQNAVVPAATVEVTNVATNVSGHATTNQTGYFEVDFLVPGAYSVSVESAGFKKFVQTGTYQARVFPKYLDSLRSDGIRDWDAKLLRRFQIHENVAFSVSCDFLNLTNHTQFTAPNMTVTSSAFGQLTGQSNAGRILQFATRLQF